MISHPLTYHSPAESWPAPRPYSFRKISTTVRCTLPPHISPRRDQGDRSVIPSQPGTSTWVSPPYQPNRRRRRGRPPDTSPCRGRQRRLGMQGKRGRPPDEAVRALRRRQKKHRPPNLWSGHRATTQPAGRGKPAPSKQPQQRFRHHAIAWLTDQWGHLGRPPDNFLWSEAIRHHIPRRGRPPNNVLWFEAFSHHILTRGRPPERALSDIAPQHFKARVI